MNEEIFGIENFNLISDEQYYYVFRALNIDDQTEIDRGITANNGVIQKVITNKQRYPENNKYANRSEISLQEVWDHTKSVNFYKGTNCISLSSNANVSIDYGSKYGHKYLMIKIPREQKSNVYNAGQYMISELNRILDKKVKQLPQDSEIVQLIQKIEKMEGNSSIRDIISDRFNHARTGGRFTSNVSVRTKEALKERFKNRQAFSDEQQLEYSKLMGKLTLLEISGMLPKEIFDNINIPSLTSTIGSEFSNREFVHYGEISSDEFVPISKINLDMFALLQVAKEQRIDEQKIKQIESKLIELTNQGYELINKDGKLYYSNGTENIDLNLNSDSVLINEQNLKDSSSISIDEMFEKTNGSISYSRAKNASQFVYNLAIAQRKTVELSNVLKLILNDRELDSVIEEIAQKSIAINDRIITRKNGKGIQVSESVNIDMNRGERKIFSDDEQRKIYEKIKELSIDELDKILSNEGSSLEQEIYIQNLQHEDIDISKTREERLNRYYAETIIDTLDVSKIYRNANRDKSLNEQEKERLIEQLEKADCKKLVNAFTKAGINESEVSGYIINILASGGYQGYSFAELSKLDNLDDIIQKNVSNTNLKGHVYPSALEELRGISDNDNRVGDTLIKLRDYQQKTINNVDRIFADGKRFAGVVLPTGAGKSFVAMTEMLKNQNGNILYIAPQQEILNQVQRHILKNIAKVEVLTTDEIEELKKEQHISNTKELKLPKGKILPSQTNEYVKKVFPHLKLLCYQGLSAQKDTDLTEEQKNTRDTEEKELREILKNADANLIVFDELHRSGAKTWKSVVNQLIASNKEANILGITATPIRDNDHVDMMKELAEMTHTYTEEELATKQYLGYEMYLIDAIQRGLVVEPKLVSFDFMLRETDEYQEIIEMIENEKNEDKRKQLMEIKSQIDDLISGDTQITEHLKNNISQKENEEIGKIIKNTIQKKDGRYIVFLPQHTHDDGFSETQYFEQQEKKIREIISAIDVEPEIYRLSSEDTKTANHKSITDFENSDSEHLKVMLAINKLNEGVHVDGINGEIMYRKINDGSTILYLQQLGRVIYSLDPYNPVPDEEIPIVYDIYNNYLVQNMNRTVNQTTPKSDLQKLQEVIEWMDKHGYEPDINSENTKEARKAITLKKIQNKYKKYIDGINNPRLSKSDIYEIEQIMELAHSIDLFNMEIGDRIIPPGERDLSEVQLFKVTATQRNFLELYKNANRIIGNEKKYKERPSARLNDIMNVLETLNSNEVFVSNALIKYGDTLKDIIERCPEEIQQILKEELFDYDEEYPIGQEYNFAKSAFLDSHIWNYFEKADVRNLYSCGIFEEVDRDFIEENQLQIKWYRTALIGDFISDGRKNLRGLNVKTGTKYDEEGYDYTGYDADGYNRYGYNESGIDREGFDKKGWNSKGINKKTLTKYNSEGYDKDGYNKNGYDINGYDKEGYDEQGYNKNGYDKEGYDREGYNWYGWSKDGINKETLSKYDKVGYDKEGYDEEGYDKEGFNRKGYDKEGYGRDGYNEKGYDRLGYDKEGYDVEGYDKEGYGRDGYNRKGWNRYGINKETLSKYDRDGYDKNGWDKEAINKETLSKYDKNGQDINGCDKNGFDWRGLTDEEIKLVDKIFNGINTASVLLKKGIVKEGQNIGSEVTVDELLINAGYTRKEDRKNICLQLDINANEKLGEKLKLIKSAYDFENVKPTSSIGRSYSEIFRRFSNKKYEMVLLGIIPVSKNGVVQRGTYKGQHILEYKDLMIAREKERQKIEEEEKKKRYISNKEGYNENGEYFYKGKFYLYNPDTGKKADGTYAIEARNERGFNPDKTYKDTGEYYDEDGLDIDFRNREGIDVRYNFGKDGYYYIKQEDGTYINSGRRYNPIGFRADMRHIITKSALDIRGFNIDGICKRNKDSIYDKNGFKQDGTYQETGEIYHNGYNAYGVDEDGKDREGKIDSDIIFTQEYIHAIMSGKKNTYLKQVYKNINTTNYNMILEKVDNRIYRASLMYPKIKEIMEEQIKQCMMKISRLESKLKELQQDKNTQEEVLSKYKKNIEYYKSAIGLIDPMER